MSDQTDRGRYSFVRDPAAVFEGGHRHTKYSPGITGGRRIIASHAQLEPITASLAELQADCGAFAAENGWHRRYRTLVENFAHESVIEHVCQKVALVDSELHEATNELRNGRDMHEVYEGEGGKPEGFPVELADALIRLLDLAEMLEIDLETLVTRKLDYNKGRGVRHGGKKF